MIENSTAEIVWFIIGLVLMLAELVTPGFVIVFFGVGGWVTAIALALGLVTSLNGQLIVFLSSSLLSLLLFRKQGKEYFTGKISGRLQPGQSLDDVKGAKAVVVSEIKPNAGGKVEFNGTQWQAESDTQIQKGTTVEIVERTNLILKVKPL